MAYKDDYGFFFEFENFLGEMFNQMARMLSNFLASHFHSHFCFCFHYSSSFVWTVQVSLAWTNFVSKSRYRIKMDEILYNPSPKSCRNIKSNFRVSFPLPNFHLWADKSKIDFISLSLFKCYQLLLELLSFGGYFVCSFFNYFPYTAVTIQSFSFVLALLLRAHIKIKDKI